MNDADEFAAVGLRELNDLKSAPVAVASPASTMEDFQKCPGIRDPGAISMPTALPSFTLVLQMHVRRGIVINQRGQNRVGQAFVNG